VLQSSLCEGERRSSTPSPPDRRHLPLFILNHSAASQRVAVSQFPSMGIQATRVKFCSPCAGSISSDPGQYAEVGVYFFLSCGFRPTKMSCSETTIQEDKRPVVKK